ncbi:MAG TPA: nucleoside-diphosphate kinase [Spirochaetota bacterium]|nr:nucleoside-diphosphate kinase [Spirochaetota bacterium]
MANREYTLVILKPDCIVKSLTGNIISRLSEARLRIVGSKVVKVSRELAEKHYAHLKEKPFFNDLFDYFSGKIYGEDYERVLVFVYEGEDAIGRVRRIAGATNPFEADPTTIRGAYGRINQKGVMENVIHSSDSPESAEKEIKNWFKPDEIVEDIYATKKVKLDGCEARVWAE